MCLLRSECRNASDFDDVLGVILRMWMVLVGCGVSNFDMGILNIGVYVQV